MTQRGIKSSFPQSDSTQNYKLFFLFFLILNLARIIAGIIPELFLYGLDYYRFLPFWLSVVCIFISLLFLSRVMNEKTGQFLRFLASSLYKTDGTINWTSLLITIGVFIAGFYFLSVKPYLGDGASRILDLEKGYLHTLKDYFDYRSFQFLSVLLFDKTGDVFYKYGIERFKTFYFYNCIGGIIFLYFLFCLQSDLFETAIKRVVAFFFIVFQAYLILFMGYIEYYAIPLSLSVMYVYYAIRCIKGKTSVWYPAFILLLLILFHLLGVILLPSLVYLLILRRTQDSVLLRFFSYCYPKTLLILILTGIIITLTFRPGPLNILLIVPTQLFSFYNSAPYIIFHLSEIVNLIILGAGFSLFGIVLFRKTLFTLIKNDPLLNFLAINIFFGLLLIIFFNPSGNLAADWDIMTIPLLMLNILGIVLLLRYSAIKLNLQVYGIIVSQVFIFFILWFLVNTVDDAAAERIITIQNHSYASGNPQKQRYTDGLSFKYYFFMKHDMQKCNEIAEICLSSVNDESLREYSTYFKMINAKDMTLRFVNKYISYLEEKIEGGSATWSDYYNLAGYGYFEANQYDRAVWALKKGLDLNPRMYALHYLLARSYEMKNDVDSALVAYARYDSLFDENNDLRIASREVTIDNIFELYRKSGRFQEGISFFKERTNKGYLYLYYLGSLYAFREQFDLAQECYEKVLKIEHNLDKDLNLNIAQIFYINKQYAKSWELTQKVPWFDNEVWVSFTDRLKNTQWYKETILKNRGN